MNRDPRPMCKPYLIYHAVFFLLFLYIVFIALPNDLWANGATVELPQTGQTICYDSSGNTVNCPGTGQDAEKRRGMSLPSPRFTDNGDGTITDNLTSLIWLKDANCSANLGDINKAGALTWQDALDWVKLLAHSIPLGSAPLAGLTGPCGLSDSSSAGDWRLPNRTELLSIIDFSRDNPALPSGHPFSNLQSNDYWTSTTYPGDVSKAWVVNMKDGDVKGQSKNVIKYVLPVRNELGE